jgi:hypothetical protein
MNGKRDEKIRNRAYGIWEREGRPQGRHEHHWHQAIREVDDESADDKAGAQQPSSNADARLSGEHAVALAKVPTGPGLLGETVAKAKRTRVAKVPAKAKKPKA